MAHEIVSGSDPDEVASWSHCFHAVLQSSWEIEHVLESSAINYDAELITTPIWEQLVHVVQDRSAFVVGSIDGIDAVGSQEPQQRLAVTFLLTENLPCLFGAKRNSVARQHRTHLCRRNT